MACYHFRIKTDKRPDGGSTQGAIHAEYINREGKYQDIDATRLLEYGTDLICGESSILNSIYNDDKNILLYESPYGNIIKSKNGLHVTEGASQETAAIAINLAKKMYTGQISVTGSKEFKEKILFANNELDLKVNFSDTEMELQNINYGKEKTDNNEKTGEKERPTSKNGNQIFFEPYTKFDTGKIFTKEKISMSNMPMGKLDDDGKRVILLLSDDEAAGIYELGRRINTDVRWSIQGTSRLRTNAVNFAVEKIIKTLSNTNESTLGETHLQYINRENVFKKRGGCLKTGNHLPPWAENDAKKFFSFADKYERSNGTRYREIEFSLPNELNIEQQQEIIDEFIQNHLKDYYYAYAVHDKIGALSNGQRHPHVHIMFSERELDELEKITPRTPELFFKQANSTNPEKGGCKKNPKWNGKDRSTYLNIMREDFAKIQNKILKKYGVDAHVDHRRLEVQREEAIANGNIYLAKALDRLPEPVLSLSDIIRENNPKIIELNEFRKARKELFDQVNKAQLVAKSMEEDRIAINEKNIAEKSGIINNLHPKIYSFADIIEKKNEIISLKDELNTIKPLIISMPQAIEEARNDMLRIDEKIRWQDILFKNERIKNLMEFKNNYRLPEKNQDKQEILNDAFNEIDKEIRQLRAEIKEDILPLKKTFHDLSSLENRITIQKKALKILKDNQSIREKYLSLSDKIINAIDDLAEVAHKKKINIPDKFNPADYLNPTEEIIAGSVIEKEKNSAQKIIDKITPQVLKKTGIKYTISDVIKILNEHYKLQMKEVQKLTSEWTELRHQVISPERALYMAKNTFTKGKIKILNEETRLYKKRLEKFKHSGGTDTNEADFLANKRKELIKMTKEIDNLLSSPYAKEKITSIKNGILEKNIPVRKRFEELTKTIESKKNAAFDTKARANKLKGGLKYRKFAIQVPKNYHHTANNPARFEHASAIEQFINGAAIPGTNIVELNARKQYDDWEWLDEFEKDELINKVRER